MSEAVSVLIDFEKAGFPTPDFSAASVYARLAALDVYFSTLLPFLRAGQLEEALHIGAHAVTLADKEEKEFQDAWWFTD